MFVSNSKYLIYCNPYAVFIFELCLHFYSLYNITWVGILNEQTTYYKIKHTLISIVFFLKCVDPNL